VFGGIGLATVCVLPFLAWVPDEEMAPSFLAGDLVLILPVDAHDGDVVAVVDPLDPSRWTLRRVITVGGAVRYEDGVYYTASAEPPRVLDMDRGADEIVRTEDAHLVRYTRQPVRWTLDETPVAEGTAFLGADARDVAMDSRWWGAVPLQALQGVVAVRVGKPTHPWRGWVSGRTAR
jgi:signal peptidase I